MGFARGVQCRHHVDDDTIWLSNKTAIALCDYLLRNNHNSNNNGPGVIDTTIVTPKAQCLATMEARVASVVVQVAEEGRCSNSMFAFPAPWNRAFWAGVGPFACYWVLFGLVLESVAVEACRDASSGVEVGDDVREMDDDFDEHGGGKGSVKVWFSATSQPCVR